MRDERNTSFCRLRNSAYVLSKLILKLSDEFEIMLSNYAFYLNCLRVTKLLRLKMVNLNDLEGFAFTVTACCKKESRYGKLILDRSKNLNRPASKSNTG